MTIQELEHTIVLYGKEIYSFCLCMTGKKEWADDLYQDTFLKATEKIETIQCNGNLKSYFLSVAIRLWKNQKRKYAWRNRIVPVVEWTDNPDTDMADTKDVLQDYMQEERKKAVKNAVNCLPDKYKIPVLLYYMEELTVTEIADTMKLPAGTVKSRLSAARKRLEKELEEYRYE